MLTKKTPSVTFAQPPAIKHKPSNGGLKPYAQQQPQVKESQPPKVPPKKKPVPLHDNTNTKNNPNGNNPTADQQMSWEGETHGTYYEPSAAKAHQHSNFSKSMPTDSATQTQAPPPPPPPVAEGPPNGVSLFEWYSRPRRGAFRLYSSGNVDLEDATATSVEVAPTTVRPDMPYWNGKLETLDLFHGSLNMYFAINRPIITRYQAIYLTVQSVPLQFQLEIANLHFMQYYEIIFILQECYHRIQLSKLRCRSSKIEDVLDYLAEHIRLYKQVDSIAGIDAQELLQEGMPAPYRPPVKPKPVTKREHLQEVELMAYHLRYKSAENNGTA